MEISPELICSGSRQRKISQARALIAYLAVEETGHPSADIARYFGINEASVFHAVKNGKIIFDENQALMIAGQ